MLLENGMLTDVEKKLKTKRKVARALNRLKANDGFEINLLPVMPTFEGKWVLCAL